jgi:hypothetical protein
MMICYLTILKDIILILTALTTAIVAIFGITKWRSEFKGKTYFEVSFKFLKSVYKLRDNFLALRANFISINELLPNDNDIKNYEYENRRFVINNRLKPFNEAYNEFNSILPEIEALFGKEFKKKCVQIGHVIFLYENNLNEYMQLYGKTNNMEHFAELGNGVFMQSKDDKYKTELDEIISSIETEISKHIKMK